VDLLLSEHRDIAAATRLFEWAVTQPEGPQEITLDGYAAAHAAVAE
jgi:transposase-like protein